jgi:hypothetical protein
VDTVRHESDAKRRPFTLAEIQSIVSAADPNGTKLSQI